MSGDSTMDDLAELRRMINRTKRNITSYAGELNGLKSTVNDLNTEFR
jgi:hypothetical protein